MHIKTLIFTIILASMPSANTDAAEERVYQWTDADGVVHYSSQPPPLGTDASEKALKPIPLMGSQAPQARTVGQMIQTEMTEREQAAKDREELARKRIEATTYNEALKIECAQARSVTGKLSAKSGVQIRDSAGNIRVMGDDERKERLSIAQNFIKDNCY